MIVKMRPFSKSRIVKLVGNAVVSNATIGKTASRQPGSSTISVAFGDMRPTSNDGTKKRSLKGYYQKGLITLPLPVPNYFILGSDLNLLSKILPKHYLKNKYNLSKLDINKVINCDCYYDFVERKIIMPEKNTWFNDQAFDIERYEFGGKLLLRIIDELNVEEQILYEVQDYGSLALSIVVEVTLGKSLNKRDRDRTVATKMKTALHVVDEYYLDVSSLTKDNMEMQLQLNSSEFIDTYNHILDKLLYEGMVNRRIKYLLALAKDPEALTNLKNSIQSFCVVIPVGYRQDTEMGVALINRAYSRLITAANDLAQIMGNKDAMFGAVIAKYKEMLKCYRYVNINHDELVDYQHTQMQSFRDLKSQLISKEGHIRDKLQSVTIDCSARTVIVVDPHMSIDSVGVPYSILRDLFEYRFMEYINEKSKGNISSKNKISRLKNYGLDTNTEVTNKIIDEFAKVHPIVIGRQPTLWRFGIQGFKIVPVTGNALVLSPLCVSAFNADFDGDQMHMNIPISPAAVQEVKSIMMNVNNIYLMRDGSCHIYPRHEIIYGLWRASMAKPTGNVVIKAPKLTKTVITEIHEAIENDKYNLDDIVEIGSNKYSLGVIAVKTCGGLKYADYIIGSSKLAKANKLVSDKSSGVVCDDPDEKFSESWSKELLTKIHGDTTDGVDQFVNIINNWTVIGTSVATHYPPNLSIKNLPNINTLIKKFNSKVVDIRGYFNIGLQTEEGYRGGYSSLYSDYDEAVTSAVLSKKKNIGDNNVFNDIVDQLGASQYIGDDNGFKLMADSKCRGSKSTMKQVFCMKGKVMKNSNEAFNSVISHSMAHGLNDFEHFTTAYGGRQGQIDKSIETSKPGYITRMMAVSANEVVIRSTDCGTKNGLLLDYDCLKLNYMKTNVDEKAVFKEVYDAFKSIVVGRYVVEKPDNQVVRDGDVRGLFNQFIAQMDENGKIEIKQGCHMRSPITCEDPCCVKCYGFDPGTHRDVEIGRAVGYEASQSIGQPGTQLTMKNFQSGGVVGEGNLTSSFDLTKKYLELTDLNSGRDKTSPIQTDIMAPMEAEVRETYIQNGLKIVNLVRKDTNTVIPGYSNIYMYSNIRLKKSVKKGETICEDVGDLNIANVNDCMKVDGAIFYLIYKLWSIFNKEVSVQFKHFEVLVSSMIFYTCRVSFGYYKAAQSYTLLEYMIHGGKDHPELFYKTISSVKQVADNSADCLRSVMFEDLLDAVRKHIITNNVDECKDQYVRMSLGLKPTIGDNVR